MPETSRAAALRRVYQDALAAGLDDEGARVAAAIAATEHGYEGALGDNGQSAGTFQLYAGGQLPAYAASQGISVEEAKRRLQRDPHAANDWALSTYLGAAIRRGQQQGLHGADLATYAQRTGQVSVSPERAGANYQTIANETSSPTGGDGVDTSGDRPPSEFEPPSRAASGGTGTGAVTRADRMRARADELRRQRAALDAQLTALSTPSPGETTDSPLASDIDAARAARQNRVAQLRTVQRQADALDAEIRRVETDAANDADPKPAASETRAPSTVSTSANEPWIVTRMPDGSLKREPNPNYVAPKAGAPRSLAANSNEPFIVREMPDGTIKTEPNPNYRADRPKTTTHVVGGRLVVVDENGQVTGTTDLRTPEEIQKGKLDLQKTQEDLLPKQQQILQSHIDTVKYLQGMVERGEMDPTQADAYVQLSKQATESALKGYTPFQEMTERRQAEQARQKMGIDLLNQRLASGTSLANSLMGAATNNSIMLRPGQTSLGIDPLAGLGALLGDLQGGQDVPALARGMLAGGQTPPAPTGPMPAGL